MYKFSMCQAVFHQCPGAEAEFRFKCRNREGIVRDPDVFNRIREEILHLNDLRFQPDEIEYLRTIRYLKPDFIDYLETYRLDTRYLQVQNLDGNLDICIRGPWVRTIMFEIPLLAIINECFFEPQTQAYGYSFVKESRLNEKIAFVKYIYDPDFKFADFGTRRRFSESWQVYVLRRLAQEIPQNFVGTSNVLMARTLGLTPIGTMAHEWIQGWQAMTRLRDSQKAAFQAWADEYRGDLGIALSDTLGANAFFSDFDMYFSKLFDGVRHDSGDPVAFGERVIQHYLKMKIDPMTKSIVFSDGLDFHKAFEIYQHFHGRIRTSFGIGTNLMNDTEFPPLNIVIKMTECNGQPVAKISDAAGKTMCEDDSYLKYLKSQFNIGG